MSELTKIIVTALVTIVTKEVVTAIIRKSPAAGAKIKGVLSPFFKRHLLLLNVIMDLFVIILGFAILLWSTNDMTLATRSFVAVHASLAMLLAMQFQELPIHIREYRESLRQPQPTDETKPKRDTEPPCD